MRFIKLSRAGVQGWAYLNHEEDLARAAAEYHRSQSERYEQARRQQAPNGRWYLAPRAYEEYVGISPSTRDNWRENGIPIFDGEKIDTHEFPDGNGQLTPFYSEEQADKIIKARTIPKKKGTRKEKKRPNKARVSVAAKLCNVCPRLVRQLARSGEIEAQRKRVCIRGRTHECYIVTIASLKNKLRELEAERAQQKPITKTASEEATVPLPDPVTVELAAQLCGRHHATINKRIRAGKIRANQLDHGHHGGRRFVVSKKESLEFESKQWKALSPNSTDPYLLPRQIYALYPRITAGILRYYRDHIVPPRGRSLRVQRDRRPAGLRCRHQRVRKYEAEDVRVLNAWLAERENGELAQWNTLPTSEDTSFARPSFNAEDDRDAHTHTASAHPTNGEAPRFVDLPPAASAEQARKRRGRPPKEATLKMQQFCYIEYRLKRRKRRNVHRDAKRLDKSAAPKREKHVALLADRFAEKCQLPPKPSDAEILDLLRRAEAGKLLPLNE